MAAELPKDPTEDEFGSWLRPPEALGLVGQGLGNHDAAIEIMRCVRAERFRVAASELRYTFSGQPVIDRLVAIPPAWWGTMADRADALFWRSSGITFHQPANRLAVHSGPLISIQAFGVRMERAGIYEILEAAGIPQPTEATEPLYRAKPVSKTKRHGDRVPEGELRKWFADYARVNQRLPAETVRAAAIEHFNDRPVSREQIRRFISELNRTENRGKPRKK